MANKTEGVVQFVSGTVYKQKRGFSGDRQDISTLEEALHQIALNCGLCGCDPCLGYISQMDVATGDPVVIFAETVDDVLTLVVMPRDEGLVYLKAAKNTRDAAE